MKTRNYEKQTNIYILLVMLIIIEIIFIASIYNKKIYTYEILNAVVVKENIVLIIISDKQFKTLNKNSYIYLEGKKIKYKIFEDRGYIIERKNEKYKEILIEFKFNNKYKVNDSLSLILKNKKIRVIEIFKTIWEDD